MKNPVPPRLDRSMFAALTVLFATPALVQTQTPKIDPADTAWMIVASAPGLECAIVLQPGPSAHFSGRTGALLCAYDAVPTATQRGESTRKSSIYNGSAGLGTELELEVPAYPPRG